MNKIYIKDIIEKFGGKLISGDVNIPIENVCIDTRLANENNIFFGIKTQKANGSDFLYQALEKNVKAAIVDHCDMKVEGLSTVVVVDDVKDVLEKICSLKHEINPHIKVIAITRSVGKTTTKDLISAVLSVKYQVNKTYGNFNNDLGVPITFLQTYAEDISVIEMGMNHFGEIDKLSRMVKPDLAVITNIGSSHIGNLGSKDNIFKAKMEILNGMYNKALVVNADDDYLGKLAMQSYSYGIENPKSELIAKNIEINADNTKFQIEDNGMVYNISSELVGQVQVYNILCALRIAKLFEIPMQEAINAIQKLHVPERRLNVDITPIGIKVINDTYNASFESMQNALKFLDNFKEANTYAIIGDMLEQGEMAKTLHKEIGGEFKNSKIKSAIFIRENAKYMYEGAKESKTKTKLKYFATKKEAFEYIDSKLKPFDVVLVKASNAMKFDEIVKHIYDLKVKDSNFNLLKRKK